MYITLLKIIFLFIFLSLNIAFPNNVSAKVSNFNERNYFCRFISNAEIRVQIIIRKNATENEISAALFLKNSLRKLSKKNKIYICNEKRNNLDFVRIKLSPRKDIHSKSIYSAQKISISVSKKEIEISYTSEDDVWGAIGIFLDDYCNARFFAPLPLGAEIPKYKNLRLPCGTKTISIPFIERSLFSGQKMAREFELINGQKKLLNIRCHNIPHLLSQEIRNEYPNWFSLCNGKRRPSQFAQLDFLNREARSHISILAKDYFKKNPNLDIISICYADNGSFDTTKKTIPYIRGYNQRDYSDYSNLVFDFTNDIAKRIAKKFPEKYVAQLAYLRTETPPDFKLEKNVAVILCTDKGNWFDPIEKKIDKKLIEDWGNSGSEILSVHDYNYGRFNWIPREISEYIAESINDYHNAGFKSYLAESYPIWAYDIHKIWIATKLLKNPSLKYDSLKNQFFCDYYKESADDIKKFFEIANNAWKNRKDSPSLWLKLFKRPSQLEIFSKSDIENMESALNNAEKKAKSLNIAERIKEIRLIFDLTKSAYKIYFYYKKLWDIDISIKNAKDILDTLEAIKIAQIHENILFERYNEQTKYPHIDFEYWKLMNMLNPSNMKAKELLALNDSKISSEVERIFGKEFCNNSYVSFNSKSKNLLKNSSFEKGVQNWNISSSVTCKETYALSTNAARSGMLGLKLSSIDYIGISQNVRIKSDKIYTFRCYAKGKIDIGATYYMRLTFLSSKKNNTTDSTNVHYLQIPMGDFKNFKKFEITEKAPQNSDSVECAFFAVNSSEKYPISIDDFSLIESP